MQINIDQTSKLAMLKIDKSKYEQLQNKLTSILKSVDEMPRMTEDLKVLDADNPMELREDIPIDDKDRLSRDELLSNAPQVQAGCLVVPKIVE
ncbi:MAG: Asp-tRNA(Asn)/Glu-tRNA(Gln) amidotransferase subunit GatC [Clostridiales bacterium]|nr:Asp-tRNA(Asn)/Glu-tRNA(Gln) amidotransferase subunit GatC [Clostridiales bacterium]